VPTILLLVGFALIFTIGCDSNSNSTSGSKAYPTANERSGKSNPERLGRLKYERDKLRQAVKRLERERADTIRRIRSMGVRTSSDLSNHPEANHDARELAQIVSQIQQLEGSIADYESAIHKLEVVVRQNDREALLERSMPSESELDFRSTVVHESEERLRSESKTSLMEDLQIEQVLDTQLKNH